MPALARGVHVVPPGGGGVERCVRDIVRHRPGDVIVHTTDTQCVLELPAEGRFTPLAPDDLARWAGSGSLGAPIFLHAHSTVAAVRQTCDRLARATGAPRLLTLHDIWFADPTVGEAELAQRLAFARNAAIRCAPSRFIVEHARLALGAGVPCLRVPLGAEPFDAAVAVSMSDAALQARGERGFDVAVIGAIGAHKGLAALESLAALLPPPWRIAVIGYTGDQLGQGWTAGGRIWVHGVFSPDQLPRLVQFYGARLALFPPGMPESHCYALSDAWMSGLAVLAPDHGALAERIRRHGGGTLYAAQSTPQQLAWRLVQLLATACRSDGAWPLDHPLPTMEDMMATMNELYAQLPASGAARPAADDSVQALAQMHLDSRFMRREITDLQRAAEALKQQLAEREARLTQALQERDQHLASYQQFARPACSAWWPGCRRPCSSAAWRWSSAGCAEALSHGRSPRLAQPGPAGRGAPPVRPLPGAGGSRFGQDAGDHPQDRAAAAGRPGAEGDRRDHLHQQGRAGDARAQPRRWSGRGQPRTWWSATFHSLGVRILRSDGTKAGPEGTVQHPRQRTT